MEIFIDQDQESTLSALSLMLVDAAVVYLGYHILITSSKPSFNYNKIIHQ